MPWGIILLFGGGFALAAGIEQSGLAAWLGKSLAAATGTSSWLIVLVSCLVSLLLTTVTPNVATVMVLLPVASAMTQQLGVHPYLVMIPITVIASSAFILPVSTPPNAIVFASGWLRMETMARTGLLLDILAILLVIPMVYFLGRHVFGF